MADRSDWLAGVEEMVNLGQKSALRRRLSGRHQQGTVAQMLWEYHAECGQLQE